MKKIKRKISDKIERDTIVIVVNIININTAKIPNILILNLGRVGNTFMQQLWQKTILFIS